MNVFCFLNGLFKYISPILFDVTKWIFSLAIIFAYNIFSLSFDQFFLGLFLDLFVFISAMLVLALELDGINPSINMNSFYSVVINISILSIIEPFVNDALHVEDETLEFIFVCSVFITFQYFIEKFVDVSAGLKKMAKGYSFIICAVIFLIVINYRMHVHYDIKTIEVLYDDAVFIMTDSFGWVVDNV